MTNKEFDRFDYIAPQEATRIRVIKDFDGWAIDAAAEHGFYTSEIWTHYDGKLLDKETAIAKAAEFAKEIGRPDLANAIEIEP